MSKELILLEDVADLGKIGETVKVSDGYARNYLLPRHLATTVSKGILRQIEARKLKLAAEAAARLEVAKTLAAKIEGITLEFAMEVGENEKLFGSVSSQMLADGLKEKGLEIDKNIIALDENIKALGEFTVPVKVHAEVKAALKVKVVAKA